MSEYEEERVYSCSLLWFRWAERHVSATVSQCLCVPAELPGAEECNQAVCETKDIKKHLGTVE